MTRATKGVAAAIAIAILGACGSSSTATPGAVTIEDLRERAADEPNDPDAQRDLAIAELLMEGGDAARVEAQTARALALAPSDPRLVFVAAVERALHGHPEQALAGFLDAIDAAAASDAPLAPHIAESALAAVDELEESAPQWRETVRPRIERVVDRPSNIGAAALHRAHDILLELAFRSGDRAAIDAAAARAGCAVSWRIAGPFGPRELLDFDREFPVTPGEPLAERYDLGPNRGARATREYEARGCSVHLGGGPVADGGTTFAQAVVEAERGGARVLRLETPNPSKLFIDGRAVARLDMRNRPTPRVTFHEIELAPGRHVITVQVTTRHPNPIVIASLVPGVSSAPDRPSGDGLLGSYLAATVAQSRGDGIGAREALREHEADRDASSAMLQLRAAAALGDPHRPNDLSRDEARRFLRIAARRDPAAWYPPVQLARLDAADGRVLAAIAALERARERWPAVVAAELSLVELYLSRGWQAQAEGATERAVRAIPGACRPLRAALDSAERRNRADEMQALASRIVECDARSTALYQLHTRRREWDAASREIDRLAALEPTQSQDGIRAARLEIARGKGDEAAIDRLLAEMREEQPRSALTAIARADRLLAQGQKAEAATFLGGAIEAEPTALVELRMLRRAVDGEFALAPYRLSGAEVIRELEASGRTYEEPSVLVLDYTVVRVFEDGSSLELTHNIWRVQSEEALDERGEWQPPEGARILTLHTIKGDTGRRIEPDAIEGKDTISLPNLAPGDYVEYEYVRVGEPANAFPGGYLGDRFYFRSFETPFDRSELIVVLPEAMEPLIEPRGPAPETEERAAEGVRVLRWAVQESRPLVPEPLSVSPREFIPSINVGVGATWPDYIASLRDALADKDVYDPEAARIVARVLGDARESPDEAKARRLYAWVLDNVEESNDPFGLAPAMLFDRTGSRARVLAYMLRLADVRSELVLARSAASDPAEARLPEGDTYEHLLVAIGEGESRTFLSTGERGAPFGFLPPLLRGQDAIRLARGAPHVEIPHARIDADRREVEVDAHLRPDGSALVEVVEKFHGAGAVGWRNDLEGVPDATLESRFEEAYVARLVPGAQMTRLRITGRESPERPIVFEYAFEVRSLGRRQGDTWIVPGLFPTHLAPTYAPLGERTTAQLVAPPLAIDARVTLHVPSGIAAPAAPAEVTLRGPSGASFRMTAERGEESTTSTRRVRMPVMRVPASEYPDLARFSRAVDQAEARELAIEL